MEFFDVLGWCAVIILGTSPLWIPLLHKSKKENPKAEDSPYSED